MCVCVLMRAGVQEQEGMLLHGRAESSYVAPQQSCLCAGSVGVHEAVLFLRSSHIDVQAP